jgi:hypothetical protein
LQAKPITFLIKPNKNQKLSKMKDKLLKLSVLMIITGFILYAINLVVYIPRLAAFRDAVLEHLTNSTIPVPQMFGLDATSMYISYALGFIASILLFIGGAYLVLFLLEKILTRLGYLKHP